VLLPGTRLLDLASRSRRLVDDQPRLSVLPVVQLEGGCGCEGTDRSLEATRGEPVASIESAGTVSATYYKRKASPMRTQVVCQKCHQPIMRSGRCPARWVHQRRAFRLHQAQVPIEPVGVLNGVLIGREPDAL
jgi:hypothetical protein